MALQPCATTAALKEFLDQYQDDNNSSSLSGSDLLYSTLNEVRGFRDLFLSKNTEGQKLIRLYYKYSGEITRIMMQDPLLLEDTVKFIFYALPDLRSAAVSGGTLKFGRRAYLLGLKLLDAFGMNGRPDFQRDVKRVRQAIETRSWDNGDMIEISLK